MTTSRLSQPQFLGILSRRARIKRGARARGRRCGANLSLTSMLQKRCAAPPNASCQYTGSWRANCSVFRENPAAGRAPHRSRHRTTNHHTRFIGLASENPQMPCARDQDYRPAASLCSTGPRALSAPWGHSAERRVAFRRRCGQRC
jgi:hypothetical protein